MKMNKISMILLILVINVIVSYFCSAIIGLSFNIAEWPTDVRKFFALYILLFNFFATLKIIVDQEG
jgi:hypothetical protein